MVRICFNCGDPGHSLTGCPEPMNKSLIRLTKQIFQANKNNGALDQSNSQQQPTQLLSLLTEAIEETHKSRRFLALSFYPGVVSQALREAIFWDSFLSRADPDCLDPERPMPWFQSMEKWGTYYPTESQQQQQQAHNFYGAQGHDPSSSSNLKKLSKSINIKKLKKIKTKRKPVNGSKCFKGYVDPGDPNSFVEGRGGSGLNYDDDGNCLDDGEEESHSETDGSLNETVHSSLSQNIESMIPKSKEGNKSLTDAAYLAMKTLVLVAPTLALPEIVERVIELLDPEMVTYIQEFEIGVWKTPPEQNFLDVLPLQKTTIVSSNSAGDKSTKKLEMEVRESIEKKKAGGAKCFTKTEKELVEDQSKKEAEIRRKVEGSIFNLCHGFRLIKCLIRAQEVTDDPIADYFASIVERCLRALQTEALSLVKEEGFSAFSVGLAHIYIIENLLVGALLISSSSPPIHHSSCLFQSLDSLTTEKLASLRLPLTLCILRGLNTKAVPGKMAIESLKVRSLAEQQAIDQKTFSYIAPLLSLVIRKQGMGLDSSQVEEVVEQIALVVDIMSFLAAEAAKVHDLHSKLIEDCLSVIGGYHQLIKAATAGLISIGLALAPDASDADICVLLSGFLHPEAQAWYAAQPLDMTDIKWLSELWTICHDKDERNASLASDLWVENGFSVPPDCLNSLLLLLGEHFQH
ncbi:hypothetical protein PPACK8108_LOCUS11334 [Phakopsora pachyrhizi]|uniref:CCHC-type domain-containing protein n=1 Tax=Phakopsora pachyrhizi TaxID=170000 RepID=A0AAV0B1M1_PHAPC|nr:hypothetical protein PPACK8108_LOCUS11334 [Phakopsora pachyrhizi]